MIPVVIVDHSQEYGHEDVDTDDDVCYEEQAKPKWLPVSKF